MTSLAGFYPPVQSHQAIAGLVVIERARIPIHQIGIFSLVLVVALETAFRFLAVKSFPSMDPVREVLVASKTLVRGKSGLRGVAGGAVPESGELGVRSMKRPGRHEEVELLSRGRRGCGEYRQTTQEPPAHHHLDPKPRQNAGATFRKTMMRGAIRGAGRYGNKSLSRVPFPRPQARRHVAALQIRIDRHHVWGMFLMTFCWKAKVSPPPFRYSPPPHFLYFLPCKSKPNNPKRT